MYDIAIIGAGVAGSYLGHRLAQHGHQVLVLEKKNSVDEETCCTGIVSQRCLNLINVPDHLIIRKVNSATFYDHTGTSIQFCRNNDVAYISDRPGINTLLKKRAESCGVDYRMSSNATNVQRTSSHVVIKTTEDCYTCKCIVFATGFGSNLPRQIGLGSISRYTIGAQVEVTTDNLSDVEIYLDKKYSPDWFAWLVPTQGTKALMGLMPRNNARDHLDFFSSELISNNRISHVSGLPSFEAIPISYLQKTFSDRALIIGEAAGHVKPMTGGGILFGLIGADIAASVLHDSLLKNDVSAAALCRYQREWQAELKHEMMAGSIIQRIYTALSNRHVNLLFSVAKKNNIPHFISSTNSFDFDYHGKLLINLCKNMLINSFAH